jgi:hypothetical protein
MRGLLALVLCAALGLGGCGGSDSADTSSSPSGAAKATATEAHKPAHQSASGDNEGKDEQPGGSTDKSNGSKKQGAPLVKVPPISSAPVAGSTAPAPGVKVVKGADNSVQEYGTEADESARTEAAIALQAYLNYRLQEDWQAACSALAQRAREQLENFEESSKSQDLSGCAQTMATLDKGAPTSQLQKDATITEVLSFRGEGDVPGNPSYLIFKGPPGQTLYSMPMYFEAGGWKVGLALPSELPL